MSIQFGIAWSCFGRRGAGRYGVRSVLRPGLGSTSFNQIALTVFAVRRTSTSAGGTYPVPQ